MGKRTGLDWDAIRANYVANGGEERPEVWHGTPRKVAKEPKPAAAPKAPSERKYVQPALNPDQDREARKLYEDGATCPELAAKYFVAVGTIRKAILRAGGTLRTRKDAAILSKSVVLTDADKDAMVAEYQTGKGLYYLRDTYKVGVPRVREVLQERNIPMHPDGARRKHTPEQEQEVRRVYESGLSMKATAERLGFPVSSTRESLLRAGGTLRKSKFANSNKRTGNEHAEGS